MDRFASWHNTKCERYNSATYDPGAEAVDAMQQRWGNAGEFNWWNPPFHMFNEVLQKIEQEQAHGCLITPMWPQHRWWHKVQEMAMSSIELSNAPDLFLPGQYGASRPVGKPFWRVFAWRL